MRPLGDIDALVASIRELGLLNAITITHEHRLVSGLHRLESFKALGRRMIPAVVLAVSRDEAQLCEIEENLARNDLNLLECAEHLCCRKEFYERLHPETRKGGDRGNQHIGGKSRLSDNVTFSRTGGNPHRAVQSDDSAAGSHCDTPDAGDEAAACENLSEADSFASRMLEPMRFLVGCYLKYVDGAVNVMIVLGRFLNKIFERAHVSIRLLYCVEFSEPRCERGFCSLGLSSNQLHCDRV
jgi:hypothetical protein